MGICANDNHVAEVKRRKRDCSVENAAGVLANEQTRYVRNSTGICRGNRHVRDVLRNSGRRVEEKKFFTTRGRRE